MPSFVIGARTLKFLDQGWVEYLGGQGFNEKTVALSSKVDITNLLGLRFYLFTFFMVLIFLFVVSFYLDSLR